MSIVYEYNDSLYVNLTNRCLMACTYCIKYKWDNRFRGHDLKLDREPTAEEVIAGIKDPARYREIIFCGYGEPLMRLEELKAVSRWVKDRGGRVRVNTSGAANLYYGRSIVPELKGLVDAISVSLNATNATDYVAVNRPRHGEAAFDGVLDFIRECKKHIPDVTVTAVELPGLDIAAVKAIADGLGVRFKARPYLDEYENR